MTQTANKETEVQTYTSPPQNNIVAVGPSQVLAQAMQQGASIEDLTKLLELQERFERREAEKAFNVALAEFKQHAPKIIKNKTVSFGDTSYKHASLAHVVYTVAESLSDFGLSHKWETNQVEGMISVSCVLSHKLGHEIKVTLSAPADNSGKKNVIQSIGSTVSYLQRYTLLSVTGLAAEDQDDDGAASASSYISFEQVQEIETLLSSVNGDAQKLVEHFGVSSVSELPAAKYKTIVSTIKAKAAKK